MRKGLLLVKVRRAVSILPSPHDLDYNLNIQTNCSEHLLWQGLGPQVPCAMPLWNVVEVSHCKCSLSSACLHKPTPKGLLLPASQAAHSNPSGHPGHTLREKPTGAGWGAEPGVALTCARPQVMLEQMQGVVRLELSGCNDFTEAGLWSSLSARITSLSVSDCINVADDAIAAISQLLPNLAELSLQAYHVTDTALAYFTARQGHSTHTLRLLSCWEITNHGVVNVVHSLPNLTALSLSGCSKVTDDGVELVAENLRKLRSLDLSWCPRITDMALEYVACDLHRLEELVLDRCACPRAHCGIIMYPEPRVGGSESVGFWCGRDTEGTDRGRSTAWWAAPSRAECRELVELQQRLVEPASSPEAGARVCLCGGEAGRAPGRWGAGG